MLGLGAILRFREPGMTKVCRHYASLAMLLGVAAAVLQTALGANDPALSKKAKQHVREGTLMEALNGKFELNGDRVSFYPNNGQPPLRCLENLALQRIAKQAAGIGRERLWTVNGVFTEFQGRNYLLVTRAILGKR